MSLVFFCAQKQRLKDITLRTKIISSGFSGVACDAGAHCLHTDTQALQVIWLQRAMSRLEESMPAHLCARCASCQKCCSSGPSLIGIQLLCRKCQQFPAQTRISKSFKPAELRKQMELRTVSLYSCGEVLCGFLSFLKSVMLLPSE